VAFRGAGAGPPRDGALDLDAVDVTRAGCDEAGCFAAALRLGAGVDAMQPLAIQVVRLF
jgi:hypothetical protein